MADDRRGRFQKYRCRASGEVAGRSPTRSGHDAREYLRDALYPANSSIHPKSKNEVSLPR
jgi:hypothetical protein